MPSDRIDVVVGQALARAAALSDAGEHALALQSLDAVGPAGLRVASLHSARGWALENLGVGRLLEARTAYETALELDSTDPWAWLGLACVLGQLGLEEDSVRMLSRALVAAEPRMQAEPELLELVGWCQYRLGHIETACQAFEQALAINADWLSVRFDLGLVRLVLGRDAEADAHYSHGLALLAAPGGATRRGAAMVALDDLDDAVRRWPAMLAPQAAAQRSRLQRAVAQCSGVEDIHVDG